VKVERVVTLCVARDAVVSPDQSAIADALSNVALRVLGRDVTHTDTLARCGVHTCVQCIRPCTVSPHPPRPPPTRSHDLRGFDWYHGSLTADEAFATLKKLPQGRCMCVHVCVDSC
jgi:hypothetical protein